MNSCGFTSSASASLRTVGGLDSPSYPRSNRPMWSRCIPEACASSSRLQNFASRRASFSPTPIAYAATTSEGATKANVTTVVTFQPTGPGYPSGCPGPSSYPRAIWLPCGMRWPPSGGIMPAGKGNEKRRHGVMRVFVLVEPKFFARGGGGFGIFNVPDEATLNRIMVEYPLTPYSELTVRPILDGDAALGQWREIMREMMDAAGPAV